MKELPAKLNRKADEILSRYGGLRGLAEQPAWLVAIVLRSFFPEDESKQILSHIESSGGRKRP